MGIRSDEFAATLPVGHAYELKGLPLVPPSTGGRPICDEADLDGAFYPPPNWTTAGIVHGNPQPGQLWRDVVEGIAKERTVP
jgi:hypothetical protein